MAFAFVFQKGAPLLIKSKQSSTEVMDFGGATQGRLFKARQGSQVRFAVPAATSPPTHPASGGVFEDFEDARLGLVMLLSWTDVEVIVQTAHPCANSPPSTMFSDWCSSLRMA